MDIINEVMHDHRRMREILDRVKSTELALQSRKIAFSELVPIFKAHAEAKEKTLYSYLKKSRKLKRWALQGEEEHSAAIEMATKTRKASSPERWLARATVFCGLLSLHLNEEENNLYPELRKELDRDASSMLADRYRALMPPADIKKSKETIRPYLRPVPATLENFTS